MVLIHSGSEDMAYKATGFWFDFDKTQLFPFALDKQLKCLLCFDTHERRHGGLNRDNKHVDNVRVGAQRCCP